MPDRPRRRKAVFAAAAARQNARTRAAEAGVTDKRKDSTGGSVAGGPESRARPAAEPTAAERRAQALRDNLRRRKAQARARKPARDGESPPGS